MADRFYVANHKSGAWSLVCFCRRLGYGFDILELRGKAHASVYAHDGWIASVINSDAPLLSKLVAINVCTRCQDEQDELAGLLMLLEDAGKDVSKTIDRFARRPRRNR